MKKKYTIYFTLILILSVSSFITIRLLDNKKSSQVSKSISKYKEIDSLISAELPKAGIKVDSMLQNALKYNQPDNLAYAYYYKAKVDLEKGRLDSIPFFFEKSNFYSKKLDDLRLSALIDLAKGYYYLKTEDYSKSLDYYLEAKSYFEKAPISISLAEIYKGIAGVYYYMENSEKALKYINRSYEIYIKLKDKKGEAMCYGNLANIYIMTNDWTEAENTLKKAIDINQTMRDTMGIVKNLNLLSMIELLNNKSESALIHLDTAHSLIKNDPEPEVLSDILFGKGQVYQYKKDFSSAIESYLKAIRNPSMGSRIERRILYGLAWCYEKEDEFEKSNYYLKKYYELEETIVGKDVKNKIEELQWQSSVKEQDLQRQIENQKFKIKSYIYSVIILIVVLISVFIGFLLKNKNKTLLITKLEKRNLQEAFKAEREVKELQQQQLEAVNRELTALNIQLLSKNKFIGEIEQIIDERNTYRNTDKVFTELKNAIRKTGDRDKDWEQFREVFQKVHPDFFDYIQNHYPQLSKKEIRICAYIKINMTNEEMTSLLNIKHKSLISARYRIRKRLGLDNSEDLDEFVQSLG